MKAVVISLKIKTTLPHSMYVLGRGQANVGKEALRNRAGNTFVSSF